MATPPRITRRNRANPTAPQMAKPILSVKIKKEIIWFKVTLEFLNPLDPLLNDADTFATFLHTHLATRLPNSGINLPLVGSWMAKYPWIQATNGVPPGKTGTLLVTQIRNQFLAQAPHIVAAPSPPPEENPAPAPPPENPVPPPNASPTENLPFIPAATPFRGPPAPASTPTPPSSSSTSESKKRSHRSTSSKQAKKHRVEGRLSTVESSTSIILQIFQSIHSFQAVQLGQQPPSRHATPSQSQNKTPAELKDELIRMYEQMRAQEQLLIQQRTSPGFRFVRPPVVKVEENDDVQFLYERFAQQQPADTNSPGTSASAGPSSSSSGLISHFSLLARNAHLPEILNQIQNQPNFNPY